MFQLIPLVIWLLIVEAICLLVFPIIFSIFKNLKDRGVIFSKSFGILLSTYLTWLIVSIGVFDYSIISIVFPILVIAAFSVWLFFKNKKEIMDFVKENLKFLLLVELLFLSSFLTFTIVRYFDNSIVDAEKPQDFMILNCLLRTERFPLNDCWYTGKPMQYYYFGHMIISNLTKISGITSGITHNLALPLFFSLTIINSFAIIYNLTGKIKYGFLGSVFVGIVGNLRGLLQVIETGKFIPLNYWLSAHYIIPGTINEFPFFSFLHADMHAHMMAIPFTLLCLGMLLNLLKSKIIWKDFFGIIALSFLIGSLSFMNTWDYPTYLGLAILVIAIQQYIRNSKKIELKLFKNIILLVMLVLLPSFILFLPFHSSVNSIKTVGITSQKTSTVHYLIIYGLFLLASLTYLYFEIKKTKVLKFNFPFKFSISPDILLLVFLVFGILNVPWIILLVILVISGLLIWNKIHVKKINKNNIFGLALFFTAIALLIAIEFFFVDDAFTGDLERVNTVFKISMQVWILISLSSAYFFYYVKTNFLKKSNILNKIWTGLFVLLLSSSLIYPIFATYTKANNNYNFFGKVATLDGREYLKKQDFCDYDAVVWINENIEGKPVILEAKGQSFQWTSCISFNTGLPTIIGWEGHEQQWRPDSMDEIAERVSDVDQIYNNTKTELLDKYNVSYIYVGKLEKDKYPEESLNRLDELFDLVYESSEAKIYKVD
jgi:YYY domain-containing protein